MDFYFRTDELRELELRRKQAEKSSKMSVLTGRRRIGKTKLALESVQGHSYLYLFVAKKAESLLCQDFVYEIERTFHLKTFGRMERFKDLFALLVDYAKQNHFTLIVDEFQEFYNINPAVYSEIQHLWDLNKDTTKMHVIFIGSIYSMMRKIFENEKEALFGRADRIFQLQPFSIVQMQSILEDYGIDNLKDLFAYYVITGGVPKYLDILLTEKCVNMNHIVNFMLKENSPFLNEGRNQLIEEFGKDYGIYFSILELISRGKTASSEIESIIQKNVSAYLSKLENTYNVVKKFKPINAKPGSKLQKYQIDDNFLNFWFRFFHRNYHAMEIHNYDYIKHIIQRDFDGYAGKLLEKFFFELLAATKQFNHMGCYWERGHKNEIDIVAINDLEKKLVLAEVKMSKKT